MIKYTKDRELVRYTKMVIMMILLIQRQMSTNHIMVLARR